MVWHSAKEYIAHRLFKSVEELSELLQKLLNEGEMVIKWDRKIKNKGNAILSGLAATQLSPGCQKPVFYSQSWGFAARNTLKNGVFSFLCVQDCEELNIKNSDAPIELRSWLCCSTRFVLAESLYHFL